VFDTRDPVDAQRRDRPYYESTSVDEHLFVLEAEDCPSSRGPSHGFEPKPSPHITNCGIYGQNQLVFVVQFVMRVFQTHVYRIYSVRLKPLRTDQHIKITMVTQHRFH
jgi:hypothetical protein